MAELAGGLGRGTADEGGGAIQGGLVLGSSPETSYKESPYLPMERVVSLADFVKVLREVEGIPLLDPLSLFIGKLHAWHHRDDPEKTSNDRLHLELLGEIIPKFVAEAERRGVDTRERCDALLGFLDRYTTPLSEEASAGLRRVLLAR